MQLRFHSASEIFPLLGDVAFARLVEDIRQHGQREPILLHEGDILDGRNRWLACRALGIEPSTTQWNGGSPFDLVLSRNLHRRQLNASQRAVLAVELKPYFTAGARQRAQEGRILGGKIRAMRAGEGRSSFMASLSESSAQGSVRDEVARRVGVSSGYVGVMERVSAADRDLFALVKANLANVAQAQRLLEIEPVERRKALAEIRSGAKAALVLARLEEEPGRGWRSGETFAAALRNVRRLLAGCPPHEWPGLRRRLSAEIRALRVRASGRAGRRRVSQRSYDSTHRDYL